MKRPHGKPRPQWVIEQYVAEVQRLIADGRARWEIVRLFGERGVSPKTTDRYIARARVEWRAAHQERAATEHEAAIHALEQDIRILRREKAWGPLVSLRRLLIEVLGVAAPQRVDARVAVAQVPGPPVDLSDVPDELLEALERVLRGRVDKALDVVGDALPMLVGADKIEK